MNSELATDAAKQSSEPKLFAAISFEGGSEIDQLIEETVQLLKINGIRLAGYQLHEMSQNTNCCSSLHLESISNGEISRISQELGSGSSGCRLDPAALANLTNVVCSELTPQTQMLILNRFGRGESDGQGFRIAIEKAIGMGIPVLSAVRQEYVEPWRDFCGEYGIRIPSRFPSIISWCNEVLGSDIKLENNQNP